MKNNRTKLALIVTVILTLTFTNVFTQNTEFTKEYSEEYSVDESKYFSLTNKFGSVNIENWDSDKLSVKVVVKVEEKNEEKAREILDKINVVFDEQDTLISANTEITSPLKAENFSIDYTVKMPSYLRIGLTNSYGDTYIQELNGKSMIVIKYGTLKAEKLIFGSSKPRSIVILAYSDGTITECDWLKLDISYSDISIDKGEALILKSKYSDINIDEALSIVSESKYDDPFEVEKVENFVCTGEYSDYEIGYLANMLNADLKYSGIEVAAVSKDFTSIELMLKYGNAEIDISNEASYLIEAESDFGSISYPEGEIDKVCDKTDTKITGIIGKNADTSSKVTINTKYGNVDLE